MSDMKHLRAGLLGALAMAGVATGPLQTLFRGRHHKAKLLRRAAKIARKAKTRRIGRLARAARKISARSA